MNAKWILFGALAYCCSWTGSFAQAGCPPEARPKFSFPEIHLREDPKPPVAAEQNAATPVEPVPASQDPAQDLSATTGTDDANLHGFNTRSDRFYLVQEEEPSDNLLVRGYYEIFEPEPIRIGRTTTISGSVVTAVKRKNPLCLLNPVFLNISW